jgi:hypothetical protein
VACCLSPCGSANTSFRLITTAFPSYITSTFSYITLRCFFLPEFVATYCKALRNQTDYCDILSGWGWKEVTIFVGALSIKIVSLLRLKTVSLLHDSVVLHIVLHIVTAEPQK